jgi:type II secretory pathway component PulM
MLNTANASVRTSDIRKFNRVLTVHAAVPCRENGSALWGVVVIVSVLAYDLLIQGQL